MSEEKTAQERAKETRDRIAGEVKRDEVNKEVQMQDAEKSLEVIRNNPELASLYNQSAKMGSENTQQSFPLLKLHVANKSKGNVLLNGEEPNDGWFFHTKTKSQFKEPIIHVLSISRSFYAKGQADPDTGVVGKPKFTQLLSGVITDNGEYQPFIMYFTGSKLNNLWNFAKLVQPFTNQKPVAIPMFALSVKFSREKIDTKYGPASIVKFDLVRDANSNPVLVGDPGEFVFLRDLLTQTEEVINSIVEHKDIEGKDSQGNVIENIPFPDEE